MGNYHGAFPENVQLNKKRARCAICGRRRFVKFMFVVNRKYICKKCKNGLTNFIKGI